MSRSLVPVLCTLASMIAASPAEARDWRPTEPLPPAAPRALVLGDSNIYGPMGDALQAGLEARGYVVWRRGLPSTGLARQEHYDWIARAREMIAAFHPDVVIAQLGGNDITAITWADRSQPAVRFVRHAAWRPLYEARARAFFELLTGDGRRAFFLSPTNRGVGASRVARVRDAQAAAAQGVPRLTFIDMFPITSDERGRWLWAIHDERGRRVVVRRSDQIHLNDEGGLLIGGRVLARLAEAGLGPDKKYGPSFGRGGR